MVSNQIVSSRDVQAGILTPICRKTAYNYILKNPYLKHMKLARKPPLKPQHKVARLDWCREHMSWTKEWECVLFSDEKNLTLMVLTVSAIIGTIYVRKRGPYLVVSVTGVL